MLAIAAGALSFLVMLLADWSDCRERAVPALVARALAVLLFAASLLHLVLAEPVFSPPLVLRLVGGLLALASLGLLYLSLHLEIAGSGRGGAERTLVTRGSYGLSRHPGVLWLFAFHASLVAASGSLLLLLALPLWTAMNVLLVLVEDSVFFPRLFGAAYTDYRGRVPFLLPTGASVRRTLSAWRGGPELEALPARETD